MSSVKEPLILVIRRRIWKNISMICASSLQNIWPHLLTVQKYYIRIISCTDSISPQTSSFKTFLPNSWPTKVFFCYLHHLWWPNVPHWRHTQPNSPSQYWFSLWTLLYRDVFHQRHIISSSYQHVPKKTTTNIGFGPHWHTPATTNV